MGKIFDKVMKTKWKDMGSLLKVPKTGTTASSPQEYGKEYTHVPYSKSIQPIPVPPDTGFAQALGPSLQGLARQQMEQQAQTFNGAFATSSGAIGGGLANHTHTYATMHPSQYNSEIPSEIPVTASKESHADPHVDAAVNDVIARLKGKKKKEDERSEVSFDEAEELTPEQRIFIDKAMKEKDSRKQLESEH